jgi:ribonucleoside-diphosphate reductase alpha chain
MHDASLSRRALAQALVAAPGEQDLEQCAARVADALASAEPAGARALWRERFAAAIAATTFLPSLPALANAGRGGQLAACFVLEPDDSLASIYGALGRAALIQQGSGGTGIDLSRLRPRGAPIDRSGGISCGPVGFLELFATSAQVNRQAGRRPGAHLAVLRDDHPDALEFVRAKRERPGALRGLGLALALRDATLVAARRPGSREAALLEAIADAVHQSGEPSLLFADTIARANPVPELEPPRATNPCGEQPLLPGESCVLGSLHLPAFATADGLVDCERLGAEVDVAVRMLDDLIEINRFPDEAIAAATRRTRKLGLGVMGFADVLLLRGIGYDEPRARDVARDLLGFVAERARMASENLARERGAFPVWSGRGHPRRNATLLAIAPTGTLRLLAGCNAGVEPFLQPVLGVRHGETSLLWVDRWLERWAARHAADPAALYAALRRDAPESELPGLGRGARALLRRAWEVPPAAQIALQATVQAHVDGAVSKTIHLPVQTPPSEIARLIRLAHRLGCKGVALYRRGSHEPALARGEPTPDLEV